MKKTLVSLAAAAALTTGAMAADKGIDIVTTGQAVIYYQTSQDNHTVDATDINDRKQSLFNQKDSSANVGVQLNLGADLGNNFTFGSQLSYLGTAGLEKNLVSATRQNASLAGAVNAYDPTILDGQGNTNSEIALTKIFVAKKIANTTVKIGRQELPKSLSPLAYSEGWNVFKNTFDAILVVNSDIPDTTLVGAYVSGGTGMDLATTDNLVVRTTVGNVEVDSTAYMLTVQNKSIPMTTVTASYYALSGVADDVEFGAPGDLDTTAATGLNADALWLDVAIASKDLPLGLKIGLQAGQISPESSLKSISGLEIAKFTDTTAFGAKVSMSPMDALTVGVAYTSVDGAKNVNVGVTQHAVSIKNTGTATKSPLYTQMVANQNAIALDADTLQVKVAYNTGDYGSVSLGYTTTSAGESNQMGYTDSIGYRQGNDYQELDLIYKVKASGVQYFVAYVNQSWDKKLGTDLSLLRLETGADKNDIVRVWARYAF